MNKIVVDDAMVERAQAELPVAWITYGGERKDQLQDRWSVRKALQAALNPQRRYTDTPREERRKGVEAPSGACPDRATAWISKQILAKIIGHDPKVGTSIHWRHLESTLGHGRPYVRHDAPPPIVTAVQDGMCCVSYQRVSAAKPEPHPCLTENPMKETVAAVVRIIPAKIGADALAAYSEYCKTCDSMKRTTGQNYLADQIYRAMRAKEIEEASILPDVGHRQF